MGTHKFVSISFKFFFFAVLIKKTPNRTFWQPTVRKKALCTFDSVFELNGEAQFKRWPSVGQRADTRTGLGGGAPPWLADAPSDPLGSSDSPFYCRRRVKMTLMWPSFKLFMFTSSFTNTIFFSLTALLIYCSSSGFNVGCLIKNTIKAAQR